MNLADDLAAFLQEHKRCGLLDSQVTTGDGGNHVMLACERSDDLPDSRTACSHLTATCIQVTSAT